MNSIVKYGLIAAVVAGFVYYGSEQDGGSYTTEDIDLNAVLDVTVDTIYAYEEKMNTMGEEKPNEDDAFLGFTEELETRYNAATPALYSKTIGLAPQNDASIMAFEDTNGNSEYEESEDLLFMVEIDGENSRVIASSRSGAVNEHRFSGTSLLAGYLLGSMLSRQRSFGNPAAVAGKKPVTARAAARARSGSGSHSRGK